MPITQEQAEQLAQAYTGAWNSGSPKAVAEFYAPAGGIIINGGEPWTGRSGIQDMAAGFFADVPDLFLVCDDVRCAGDHVVFLWTFKGTHSATKKNVCVSGWEEWDLDAGHKITSSRGWYDARDYARQVEGP